MRVHGVGGVGPAEMLGVDEVAMVEDDDGPDAEAGFFVPVDAAHRFPDDPPRELEAYSWARLNRASATRSAWLILAPFALMNLAGWMIEHDGEPTQVSRSISFSDWLSRTLARLIALSLTASGSFLVCRAVFDLFVVQCGSRPGCVDRWWLRPLQALAERPGQQLAFASLAPIGVIALVAYLTRRSQLVSTPDTTATLEEDPTFADSWKNPEFWSRFGVAHRLGLSHLAASVTVVGIMVAGTAEQLRGVRAAHLVFVGVALIGAIAFAVNVLRIPVAGFWALVAAAGAYLAFAVLFAVTRPPTTFVEGASAAAVMDATLTSAQILLIALISIVTWRGRSRRRGRPPEDRLVRWALPPSLMVAAAGLLSAFAAGTEILVARALTRPGSGEVVPAATAGIVASAFLVAMVAMTGTAVALYLTRVRDANELETIAQDYDAFVDRPQLERIHRARVLARLTDSVPLVIVVGTLVLAAIVLVVLAQVVVTGTGFAGPDLRNPLAFLETAASVAVLALPIVGAWLLFSSYRVESIRRVIGVLWDVATFWPRRFHPFAPPSYGERTIPDLQRRIAKHRNRGVLLSGHSQGSVLAVAAIASDAVDTEFVALISHGSPVDRMYARFFPEYMSPELAREVDARMDRRWANLYRDTDFIGGPIAGIAGNERLRDPEEPDGPIKSHFDYESTAAYAAALRRLI